MISKHIPSPSPQNMYSCPRFTFVYLYLKSKLYNIMSKVQNSGNFILLLTIQPSPQNIATPDVPFFAICICICICNCTFYVHVHNSGYFVLTGLRLRSSNSSQNMANVITLDNSSQLSQDLTAMITKDCYCYVSDNKM